MKPSPDEVRRLVGRLGEVGIIEMSRSPGLAAAVDQHAAAIRDVITASGYALHTDTLSDYAHGFADAALERGWLPVVGDGDFDWEGVRVLAAYWMVRHLRQNAGH